jgi:hypothetical protein
MPVIKIADQRHPFGGAIGADEIDGLDGRFGGEPGNGTGEGILTRHF